LADQSAARRIPGSWDDGGKSGAGQTKVQAHRGRDARVANAVKVVLCVKGIHGDIPRGERDASLSSQVIQEPVLRAVAIAGLGSGSSGSA
jgi:hypothetical protein